MKDLMFLLALLFYFLLTPEIQGFKFLSKSFGPINRKSCLDITWIIQIWVLNYK